MLKNPHDDFFVRKIGRECNSVDHHLALLARSQGIDGIWLDHIPDPFV